MSTPVSDVSSTPAAAAAAYSNAPNPATPVAPASPGFILSTVDLSDAAQALSLEEQGETPSEIAQALGTSVAIVDGYLGIAVPPDSTAPAPAAPVAESAPAQSAADPGAI